VHANSAGFIAYYRVSTDRQGRSGLGLEAQRAAVGRYLAGIGGILMAEHTEVETGRRNDRPELQKALAACRKHKARLVIAKLDRLSRNVAFIATMMDSGVEFVACDNPQITAGGCGRSSFLRPCRKNAVRPSTCTRSIRNGWGVFPKKRPKRLRVVLSGDERVDARLGNSRIHI
jgi:hypothetical protein